MYTPDHNILNSIKDHHLKPRPRWQFILRNYFFWSITIVVTLLGSIAVATALFIVTDHDWDVFRYLDKSPLVTILEILPYLWIGILILMILAIRYSITRTKSGYRYRVRVIVGASISISLFLGILLYAINFGTFLHETLSDQLPWYEQLIYTKSDAWYAPDQGLLSGTIESLKDDTFTIKSIDGAKWDITTPKEVRDFQILSPGLKIKIIGEKTGERTFNAEDIELWNE